MIHKSVLDNGIRIVSEKIPAARSVTVGIWIETGSRHEAPRQLGISHFVEHMLFKGTTRRTALAIAKEIDSVGGVLNGFTSREYTCYYAKVLADKLPLAVDLLTDIVQHSSLDPIEIEKERRVILQEISMLEDNPDDLVHELFSQIFWRDHPLGQPILGRRSTIEQLTADDLRTFLQERYTSDRLLISAAGNVEHQQLVDLFSAQLGNCPPGLGTSLGVDHEYARQLVVTEKDLEQVHICLGTRCLPHNHPQRFVAYLLSTILGGGMSSRLFQKIREELGLAYSVYSTIGPHSDAGSLVVYAGVAPENAVEVIDLLLAEFRRLCREPVGNEELRAAKDQLRGNLLLSLESSDNCMTLLAQNEIYLGRIFTVREMLRHIEQVSVADLQQLATSIFRDEFLNLQVLGKVASADLPESCLSVSVGRE